MWGVAYEIDDNDTETLASVNHRERRFTQIDLQFYPHYPHAESQSKLEMLYKDFTKLDKIMPFSVNVYVGTRSNPLFLGEASVEAIARQIASSSGPSGPNADYVFKLCDFMRNYLPNVNRDNHLFDIEKELLSILPHAL